MQIHYVGEAVGIAVAVGIVFVLPHIVAAIHANTLFESFAAFKYVPAVHTHSPVVVLIAEFAGQHAVTPATALTVAV